MGKRTLVNEMILYRDSTVLRDGAMNMAIDEVLLCESERPWLRWYGWERRTVSVGYFCASGDLATGAGAWVRRWTGGGRVAHGGELDSTYAIGVPRGYPESRLRAADAYRLIHGALVEALGEIGHRAVLASSPGAGASLPCFDNPVPADVLGAGGEKIAGGAQRRSRHGLLHQGSIQGVRLDESFGAVFASYLAAGWCEEELPAVVLESAAGLAGSKYRSRDWLERA